MTSRARTPFERVLASRPAEAADSLGAARVKASRYPRPAAGAVARTAETARNAGDITGTLVSIAPNRTNEMTGAARPICAEIAEDIPV